MQERDSTLWHNSSNGAQLSVIKGNYGKLCIDWIRLSNPLLFLPCAAAEGEIRGWWGIKNSSTNRVELIVFVLGNLIYPSRGAIEQHVIRVRFKYTF